MILGDFPSSPAIHDDVDYLIVNNDSSDSDSCSDSEDDHWDDQPQSTTATSASATAAAALPSPPAVLTQVPTLTLPASLLRDPLGVPPATAIETIRIPPPLEWKVWSRTFTAPIALLKDAVYGSSPTFWLSRFKEMNYIDISIADWVDNSREVKYTMPKKGLQGKVAVHSTEAIVVDSKDAVVVEIETKTPGVPYGGSFHTCTQHVFCTDAADPSRGDVIVTTTAAVKWLKPCSVKGMITKKVKQAMLKGLAESMESIAVAWASIISRSTPAEK